MDLEKLERAEPMGKLSPACKKYYIYTSVVFTILSLLLLVLSIILLITNKTPKDTLLYVFYLLLTLFLFIPVTIWIYTLSKNYDDTPEVCVKKDETQLFFFAKRQWHCVNLDEIKSIDTLPTLYRLPVWWTSLRDSGILKITLNNGTVYKVRDLENVADVKARIGIYGEFHM